MARVFRAVLQGPAGFQKMVAVKLLKASIQYEGAGAEFMQEAVYAGRLNHPNVVDVYELNEEWVVRTSPWSGWTVSHFRA